MGKLGRHETGAARPRGPRRPAPEILRRTANRQRNIEQFILKQGTHYCRPLSKHQNSIFSSQWLVSSCLAGNVDLALDE